MTPIPHNAQPPQSKCCGAPIQVHCPDEREGTNYYICTECGQPCDAVGDGAQWRKITKSEPPPFPCWVWASHMNKWLRLVGLYGEAATNGSYTHWHPDSPTAPEGRPIPETPSLDRFSEQPQLQHVMTVSSEGAGQSTPAETATPETDTAAKGTRPGDIVLADFARRLERERDEARAQLKSMTDQFLAVSGEREEARKAVDDAYWRGYRARLDEQTVEQPEPKNPTLWRYLQNAHDKKITFHTIGVNRMPDGGFHFYIHPQSVSGNTEDYLIWPDPFNWSDMLVNQKDSPQPDIEKFKASMRKALAQSDSPGAGVKGEKS